MKWALISILLVLPVWAGAQSASAAAGSSADEQAIAKLHDDWLKAFDTGDADVMNRIESDDFTVAGNFGQVTKQTQLDRVRERAQKSMEVKRSNENRQIRFYGDVAVLTETDHATTAEGTGDFQSTEIWVKHGDSWQVVHLHFSGLPKAE
jgi:ketosteroid isomerase-like protein